MKKRPWRLRRPAAILSILLAWAASPLAQAPPEIANLDLDGLSNLTWDLAPGAADYNVYRGSLAGLASGRGAVCHGDEVAGGTFASPEEPGPGLGWYYLVTGESSGGAEGTAGAGTAGGARALRGRCDPVMRNHLLNRVGFGPDEWSRGRLAALGRQGYLDEQLAPGTIDESGNTELNNRRAPLVPPDTIGELIALDVVNAVYARRQLEHQVTLFWDNHFNTDYLESFQFFGFYQALFPATRQLQAAKLHYDLQNLHRDLAFNGAFRDIVEAMALSPAMIVYLDTDMNRRGVPNENFARELLELHTMGVDGGYTQQDIVELAKVFTGWGVCKKDPSVVDPDDPLAACIPRNQYGTVTEPPGSWVRNFNPFQHENAQKVLFAGTPYQAIIPGTPLNDAAGIDDVGLALDAIVAHPSTARFIATKLLQRFVTESPSASMIDEVVAEWNDVTNPHGAGDLREVLRSVLSQARLLDPGRVAGKIKTPFEQVTSGFRAARGRTNGVNTVQAYLTRMQEVLHRNPVPTGYSELGGDWLDTNHLLERQNFALQMSTNTGTNFGCDVIGLLNAGGVSTAPSPSNAPAIVDFLSDVLFGGALESAERQRAIDYLETDDNGAASIYTDARIRETMGFMMGFAQFIEQ